VTDSARCPKIRFVFLRRWRSDHDQRHSRSKLARLRCQASPVPTSSRLFCLRILRDPPVSRNPSRLPLLYGPIWGEEVGETTAPCVYASITLLDSSTSSLGQKAACLWRSTAECWGGYFEVHEQGLCVGDTLLPLTVDEGLTLGSVAITHESGQFNVILHLLLWISRSGFCGGTAVAPVLFLSRSIIIAFP
jgi:hypothetical protein